MNFDLSPETEALCATVLGFARRDLTGPDAFDAESFRHRWQLAGKQGILGATVPIPDGGTGLDAVTAVALMEALGSGCTDTGFAFSVAAHLFACLMPLADFGSAQQRRRWLPRLAAGDLIAAHGITEAQAGSDALRQRTTARRRGDHYVLDGTKSFVTNAPVADVFIVQAVTQPGGGYFGLTAFVIDAQTPGLHVGSAYSKTGLRGSPTADIHLDGCQVAPDRVLGGEGSGASVFVDSMKWERTCLFGIFLGAMRRVLDSTVAFANDRIQFDAPISEFQAVQHRIVEMGAVLESARLMLFKAAYELSRGGNCEVSSALAKIAVSEAAVRVGMDAVQLRGALGILDGDAEALVRDGLAARIASGTTEIQKNNVARAMGLGRSTRPRD